MQTPPKHYAWARDPGLPAIRPATAAFPVLILTLGLLAAPLQVHAATPAKAGLDQGALVPSGAYPFLGWMSSSSTPQANAGICNVLLIHRWWVMTSADCVAGFAAESLTIHLGSTDTQKDNVVRGVRSIFIQPQSSGFHADQAMLLLSAPVGKDANKAGGFTPQPALMPAHLPATYDIPNVPIVTRILNTREPLTVVGFNFIGATTQAANRAHSLSLESASQEDCYTVHSARKAYDSICTGSSTNPNGICQGDGAAVMVQKAGTAFVYYGLGIWAAEQPACSPVVDLFTDLQQYTWWIKDTIVASTPPSTGTLTLALTDAQPYPGVQIVFQNADRSTMGTCMIGETASCDGAKGLAAISPTSLSVPTGAYKAYVFGLSEASDAGKTIASAAGIAVTVKEDTSSVLKATLKPLAGKNPGSGWQVMHVTGVDWAPYTGISLAVGTTKTLCTLDAVSKDASCEGGLGEVGLRYPYIAIRAPMTMSLTAAGVAPAPGLQPDVVAMTNLVRMPGATILSGAIVEFKPAFVLNNTLVAFTVAPSNAKGRALTFQANEPSGTYHVECTIAADGAAGPCTGPAFVVARTTIVLTGAAARTLDVRVQDQAGILELSKSGLKGLGGKTTALTGPLAVPSTMAGFSVSGQGKPVVLHIVDATGGVDASCQVAKDGTLSGCQAPLVMLGAREVGLPNAKGHKIDVGVATPDGLLVWNRNGFVPTVGGVTALMPALAKEPSTVLLAFTAVGTKAMVVLVTDTATSGSGSCAIQSDGSVTDCTGPLVAAGSRTVAVRGAANHALDVKVNDATGPGSFSKSGLKVAGAVMTPIAVKFA